MDVRDKIQNGVYGNNHPFPRGLGMENHVARMAYFREDQLLVAQFKQDVLAELGLTNHPKADLFWSHMWDMGHSLGFSAVLDYAEDWAELLHD